MIYFRLFSFLPHPQSYVCKQIVPAIVNVLLPTATGDIAVSDTTYLCHLTCSHTLTKNILKKRKKTCHIIIKSCKKAI